MIGRWKMRCESDLGRKILGKINENVLRIFCYKFKGKICEKIFGIFLKEFKENLCSNFNEKL
jgi:hypothetical protein